jgi:hypothetical protein
MWDLSFLQEWLRRVIVHYGIKLRVDFHRSTPYYILKDGPFKVLWHVDPLLGNDRGISKRTTVVAK